MSFDEFIAWVTVQGVQVLGGRTITRKDGLLCHFARARRGETAVRYVQIEGSDPREVTTAERRRLGDEKQGKRRPTKKSLEAQQRRGRNPPPSLCPMPEVIVRGKGPA